ncbi:MAG: hypothetical protein ACP6IS_02490 [Candidatus Asgardarchaeia archaeon]
MIEFTNELYSTKVRLTPENENDDYRALALFYTLMENTLNKLFAHGALVIQFENKIVKVEIRKSKTGEIVLETY